MAIELTDDGTLDTVLRCSECGEEFRYNYEPDDSTCPVCGADERDGCLCSLDKAAWEQARERQYDEFVAWAIEDATADHECPKDDEPDEDAITTSDHETFYQDGKRILWHYTADSRWWYIVRSIPNVPMFLGDFGDCEAALRAYMDRVQFWPAVWFVSDHGNAHRIDVTGKE